MVEVPTHHAHIPGEGADGSTLSPCSHTRGKVLNFLAQKKALYLATECHENLIHICVVPGVNTYCCEVYCFCGIEAFFKGRTNHVTSSPRLRGHHRRVVGRNGRAWRWHILQILTRITPSCSKPHSAGLYARLQPNKPSFSQLDVVL